jgi:hypothetical protein
VVSGRGWATGAMDVVMVAQWSIKKENRNKDQLSYN